MMGMGVRVGGCGVGVLVQADFVATCIWGTSVFGLCNCIFGSAHKVELADECPWKTLRNVFGGESEMMWSSRYRRRHMCGAVLWARVRAYH